MYSRLSSINFITPNQRLKTTTKTTQNVPEKPKRPLSSYFRFLMDKRPQVVKENPTLTVQQITKTISEQWKQLNPEEKQKYNYLALQDREKYDEALLKYKAQLTPEQTEVLHNEADAKRKDKQKRKFKKESKDEGKPKAPMGPFAIYVKENFTGSSIVNAMKELKSGWEQLSPAEKEKYTIQFQRSKQQYAVDLANWENRMIAEGKSHLVRSSTLKKPTTSSKSKKEKKSTE